MFFVWELRSGITHISLGSTRTCVFYPLTRKRFSGMGYFLANNMLLMLYFSDDDDLKYLITSEQKVWDNYKVQKDAVILLTTFDDGRADFDGEITAEVSCASTCSHEGVLGLN